MTWVKIPVKGEPRPYYWNSDTGATTWSLPRGTECKWVAHRKMRGSLYYQNMETKAVCHEEHALSRPQGSDCRPCASPAVASRSFSQMTFGGASPMMHGSSFESSTSASSNSLAAPPSNVSPVLHHRSTFGSCKTSPVSQHRLTCSSSKTSPVLQHRLTHDSAPVLQHLLTRGTGKPQVLPPQGPNRFGRTECPEEQDPLKELESRLARTQQQLLVLQRYQQEVACSPPKPEPERRSWRSCSSQTVPLPSSPIVRNLPLRMSSGGPLPVLGTRVNLDTRSRSADSLTTPQVEEPHAGRQLADGTSTDDSLPTGSTCTGSTCTGSTESCVPWEYYNKAAWRPYSMMTSCLLEGLWEKWKKAGGHNSDPASKPQVRMLNMVYEFDFPLMQQRSLGLGCIRPIRRQLVTTSPKCNGVTIEEAPFDGILDLGRSRAASAASMQERQRCHSHDSGRGQGPSYEVRYLPTDDVKFELYARTDLVAESQRVLRMMAARCTNPLCNSMQDIVVTSVQAVMNMDLWNKYTLMRQQIVKALKNRQGCPRMSEIAVDSRLQEIFPPCPALDPAANEVLLLHGTSSQTAMRVARHGFDERLSHRGRYGRGVHLTSDGCKAAQLCEGRGCIIISRVTVGHPFIVKGPVVSFDHPPEVKNCDHSPLHDSIIAQPGISIDVSGGGTAKQQHWECVVTRGDQQIFPELLVHFECVRAKSQTLKRCSSAPTMRAEDYAAGDLPDPL